MVELVKSIEGQNFSSIFIVGDLHGCYNTERTHQRKMCGGLTPIETLLDGKRIWAEKNLVQI